VSPRHLPPAGAPLSATDLWNGVAGLLSPDKAIEQLEASLRSSLSVEHVFLTSSGRAALAMILRALATLSPRRRVVVPAYTCFSVPAAVRRAGLEVAACDVDLETFDYDYDELERTIGAAPPLCVVVPHLFGFPADIARVMTLCRPKGIFVIDDAAQALGTRLGDRALGTFGDAGLYSFGRGKGVTCGSGGAAVTNSADIASALQAEYARAERPGGAAAFKELAATALMSVFLRPSLYGFPASLPFLKLGETEYAPDFPMQRLSGAQAGMLTGWQTRLARANAARSAGVAAMRRAIKAPAPPGAPPCIRFPLVCASREARERLYAAAQQRRLGFSRMYPSAISGIPEIRRTLNGQRYPQAEQLAERLLTLPVHPFVSERDRQTIVDLVLQAGA